MRNLRTAVIALLAMVGVLVAWQPAASADAPEFSEAPAAVAGPRAPDVPASWAGPYVISANGSNEVMAVAGSGGSNTRVIIWPYHGYADQFWYLEPAGGNTYRYHPAHNTRLCLDVPGSDTSTRRTLVVWTCNGGRNQVFGYRANRSISPVINVGKCLDVHTHNSGERVWLWPCNGTAAQRWSFV